MGCGGSSVIIFAASELQPLIDPFLFYDWIDPSRAQETEICLAK
jgi:hypothetical protein